MNTFKEVITTVCLAGIGTAVYKMLVPSGTFEKQLKLLISLFLILGVISPFVSGDINLSIPTSENIVETSEYITLQNSILENMAVNAQDNLSRELGRILSQEGIETTEILAKINISPTYSISIIEVKLLLPNMGFEGVAREIVEREVGEDIAILIEKAEDRNE